MVDADGSEQIWVSFYDLDENFEVDCHRFSLIAFSESGSTLSVGATAQLMLLILMLKSVALRNSGHSRSDIYVHYVNCKMFDSLVKSNICKDCRGPIFAGLESIYFRTS